MFLGIIINPGEIAEATEEEYLKYIGEVDKNMVTKTKLDKSTINSLTNEQFKLVILNENELYLPGDNGVQNNSAAKLIDENLIIRYKERNDSNIWQQ